MVVLGAGNCTFLVSGGGGSALFLKGRTLFENAVWGAKGVAVYIRVGHNVLVLIHSRGGWGKLANKLSDYLTPLFQNKCAPNNKPREAPPPKKTLLPPLARSGGRVREPWTGVKNPASI